MRPVWHRIFDLQVLCHSEAPAEESAATIQRFALQGTNHVDSRQILRFAQDDKNNEHTKTGACNAPLHFGGGVDPTLTDSS